MHYSCVPMVDCQVKRHLPTIALGLDICAQADQWLHYGCLPTSRKAILKSKNF